MGLAKGRHVERWHAVESSEMGAQQCTTQSILIKLQSKVEIIFFLTNVLEQLEIHMQNVYS